MDSRSNSRSRSRSYSPSRPVKTPVSECDEPENKELDNQNGDREVN